MNPYTVKKKGFNYGLYFRDPTSGKYRRVDEFANRATAEKYARLENADYAKRVKTNPASYPVKAQTKNWDLYWSPSGKKIATVTAANYAAAVRKAPKPYSKYKGEIYAVQVANNPAGYVVQPGGTYKKTISEAKRYAKNQGGYAFVESVSTGKTVWTTKDNPANYPVTSQWQTVKIRRVGNKVQVMVAAKPKVSK